MLIIDLNDYTSAKREAPSCGAVARRLLAIGTNPHQLVRWYRGTTQIFKEDFTLAYWAGTRVKESTDGECMKTVKYDHAFKLRTPRQMDSGVGVTVWNDWT